MYKPISVWTLFGSLFEQSILKIVRQLGVFEHWLFDIKEVLLIFGVWKWYCEYIYKSLCFLQMYSGIFMNKIYDAWNLLQNNLGMVKKWMEYRGKGKWNESHLVMSNSLLSHGLYSLWNSLGQNTGVGSLSLLQGIFLTQGLLHCRWILSPAEPQGKPWFTSLNMIISC